MKKGNVVQIGAMIKEWIKKAYNEGFSDGYDKALIEIYDKYDTEDAILITPEKYDEIRKYSYAELEKMEKFDGRKM